MKDKEETCYGCVHQYVCGMRGFREANIRCDCYLTDRFLSPEDWEKLHGKPLQGNAQVWWRQGKDEFWVSGRYIGVKEFLSQTYCDGSHPKPVEILVTNNPYPPGREV